MSTQDTQTTIDVAVQAPAPRTRAAPTAAPVYKQGSEKLNLVQANRWGLADIIDTAFFAIAAVLTLALAVLLIASGTHLTPLALVNIILFWAVLSYLALPRLHQIFTWLYVPDYFIGRTRTGDGLLGDPVNLAVFGDEEDIHEAMTAAGWVRADPITLGTSWGIIVSSVLGRSYPAAPVSNLYLFGRAHDFAYQKEVEGNPAQRHHIRFWHTPEGSVLPGGRRVDWLAAATYDRSVGLSSLTFQVTHKIDADIDIERNYVVDDVRWASPAATVEIWPDYFTSYHDKNGGGDRVVTDGDLYVLNLHEVVPGESQRQGDLTLLEARRAEAEGRRQRPASLIGGIALLALLVVIDAIRFVSGGGMAELQAGLAEAQVGDARSVAIIAASVTAGLVVLLIAVLGVFTFFGHPRTRIVLMALLTANIVGDILQAAGMGLRATSWGVLTSAGVGVLALLAISGREVQRWERERKEERRAEKAAAKAAKRR